MHYDPLAALPFLAPLGASAYILLVVVILWTILIKGFALWKAARNTDKAWFIVLLFVNSLGILELIYLIWFAKKQNVLASESSAPAA